MHRVGGLKNQIDHLGSIDIAENDKQSQIQ